jgi:hypothetical protein
VFSTAPQPYETGHAYYGSAYFPNDDAAPFYGALRAIDPDTGKIKWEWKHPSPTWSGVLSTAGGVVFTGDAEGNFIALDAASGKALWHFQCGASVYSSPMTYAVDGKQYVAVAAGTALSRLVFRDCGVRGCGDFHDESRCVQRRQMYERKINGFHLDDQGDWVADLECGHTPTCQARSAVDEPAMGDNQRRSRIASGHGIGVQKMRRRFCSE